MDYSNFLFFQVGFGDSISSSETCSVVIKSVKAECGIVGILESRDKQSSSPSLNRKLKRQRVDSAGSDRGRLDSISSEVSTTALPPAAKRVKKDINTSVLHSLFGNDVKVKVEGSESHQTKVPTAVASSTAKKPKEQKVAPPPWDSDFNPWEAAVKEEPESQDEEDAKDTELLEEAKSAKKKKHLSKKEAKALSKLEDAEINRVEGQVIAGAGVGEPQTVQDFEKLVLGSPDSSLCWIQYMAFHLSKKEHDEARSVAKKALEKINFRLESERLNVYMAWFNLENSFGSAEDADECLKEALKCNDSYKVYAQAAAVYEQQPGKVREIILDWN